MKYDLSAVLFCIIFSQLSLLSSLQNNVEEDSSISTHYSFSTEGIAATKLTQCNAPNIHIIQANISSTDDAFIKYFNYLKDTTYHDDYNDICFELNINSSILSSHLFHYSPAPIDRSCLVSPPFPPDRVLSTIQINQLLHSTNDFNHILDFINLKTMKYRLLNGTESYLGKFISNLTENMYTLQDIDNKCDSVNANNITLHHFLSNYLLYQKPLIIRNFVNISRINLFNSILKHIHQKVGVKLSPSQDFEGIDSVLNWSMKQSIPMHILNRIESPHKVVVRAVHEEISLHEYLILLINRSNKKRNNTCDDIHAYIEYLPLESNLPSLLNDFLAANAYSFSLFAKLLSPPTKISSNKDNNIQDNKEILKGGKPYLWLGDGNTIGKLHFDPFDNILVQLEGSKEFLLMDINNNKLMSEGHMREAQLEYENYIHDFEEDIDLSYTKMDDGLSTKYCKFKKDLLLESTSMVHTPIDIDDISSKVIPRVKCKVNPGDALFVPSFWWHEVTSSPSEKDHYYLNRSTKLNAAINYWFIPLFDKSFPCSSCRKYLNSKYRKFVSDLLLENLV